MARAHFFAVARDAHFIRKYLETWPNPLQIRPVAILPRTLQRRLSETIRGLRENPKWAESLNLSDTDLADRLLHTRCVISPDDHILICADHAPSQSEIVRFKKTKITVNNKLTPTQIEALLLLLNEEILDVPVILPGQRDEELATIRKLIEDVPYINVHVDVDETGITLL
jgi:predicted transcriptional regulator